MTEGERMSGECVFCGRIKRGEYEGTSDPTVVRFAPLNPVTPGHLLFVPIHHAETALADPAGAAAALAAAAQWARDAWPDFLPAMQCNIITSAGPDATQTVKHTHIHLVPRRQSDGLMLPWTGQIGDRILQLKMTSGAPAAAGGGSR